MTTDRTPADAPFEVPELSLVDDGAIRRAVRRGVVLTGLVAAAWLLLAAVVIYLGGVVVAAMHNEHFHGLALYGSQVGRPGYAVTGNSCCSGALGLTNAQTLDLRPRGALGQTGQIDGRIRRGLTGTFESSLPDGNTTPIGAALDRERPTKSGTTAFLETLPPTVSASAIVEFGTPLDEAGLDNLPFGGTLVPASGNSRAILLTDPYGSQVVSWQEHSLATFPTWVATLTPDDDDELDELGAASVAVLRTAAKNPRVHAVVVEQATVGDLRKLLENPQVRSVNVAEVGFDPARQSPDN